MSKNLDMEQFQLTLGDKINWPFILGNIILKFQDAIVKVEGEQSEQEVRESVLCLFNSIPATWKEKDPQLKKDLKAAVITQKIDIRNEWCGRKVGKPKFKKEESIDPYKLFHACVNILDRRGLISKKNVSELSDGNEFDPNKVQEVITE